MEKEIKQLIQEWLSYMQNWHPFAFGSYGTDYEEINDLVELIVEVTKKCQVNLKY